MKIVCLEGLCGVGKTTFLKNVCTAIPCEELALYEVPSIPDGFWAGDTALRHIERAQFFLNSMERGYVQAVNSGAKVLITDRWYYSTLVYQGGLNRERAVRRSIWKRIRSSKFLRPADAIFYLGAALPYSAYTRTQAGKDITLDEHRELKELYTSLFYKLRKNPSSPSIARLPTTLLCDAMRSTSEMRVCIMNFLYPPREHVEEEGLCRKIRVV